MEKVFTFWEGEMPEYIKMCLNTWRFSYIQLNYHNLHHFTDLQITPELKRFTLPQIADVIRTHILRDQGGYWLDADTIMIRNRLPTANMIGNPVRRQTTIGYLYADKPHMDLFTKWAAYQNSVVNNQDSNPNRWSIMGNDFVDKYIKEHKEISIMSVENCWPETYMVQENIHHQFKYEKFYFEQQYCLTDIFPTDMLMLHNSWTPDWYKKLSADEILSRHCTLSNILGEVLCNI